MSDQITKVITANPYEQISDSILHEVKSFIQDNVECDSVEIIEHNHPEFIDCGSNLEKICCPKCDTVISFEWWGDMMDSAYEQGFQNLEVIMSCCGETVSLNDLKYDYPCGFSKCVIEILNPEKPIESTIQNAIESIMKTEIRLINAHM